MVSSPNVDYDRLAADFDSHRNWSETVPRRIMELVQSAPGAVRCRKPLLEVGCGTGGATRWFSKLFYSGVVGVDKSKGMLNRAREKLFGVPLVRAEAAALPFHDASFVGAAAVFLLHHLKMKERERFFRELRRTVVPGGRILFATVDHEQIRGHALVRWFPKIAEIDRARFPALDVLENELRVLGCAEVAHELIIRRRGLGDAEYLEKVKSKFISTLSLLPEEEFRRGLAKMEAELAEQESFGDVSWYGRLLWATL